MALGDFIDITIPSIPIIRRIAKQSALGEGWFRSTDEVVSSYAFIALRKIRLLPNIPTITMTNHGTTRLIVSSVGLAESTE